MEYLDEVQVVGVDEILAFPVKIGNQFLSLYEVTVFSVLDHHVESGYYHKDGVITTVNGISRSATDGCRHFLASGSSEPCSADPNAENYYGNYPHGLIGYTDGNSLDLPFIYDDDDSSVGVLWYDGHSGYDYGVTGMFQAATSGILCVSTNDTEKAGGTPWRNPSMCPVGNDSIVGMDDNSSSWKTWHAVYIVYRYDHRYQTWYLHAEYLDQQVMDHIMNQGYSIVAQGQTIGKVGHCCRSDIGTHLHFELRRDGGEVDPYEGGKTNDYWFVD